MQRISSNSPIHLQSVSKPRYRLSVECDRPDDGTVMTEPDASWTAWIASATLHELLDLRVQIDVELKSRQVRRTNTSLEGELMERVVAEAYQGELAPTGTPGFDVELGDGTRIQVKTRTLAPGILRFWAFDNFDFDLAVVVSMDSSTGQILFAREFTQKQVRALTTPHASGTYRLPMGRGRDNGVDVTDRLRDTHLKLY